MAERKSKEQRRTERATKRTNAIARRTVLKNAGPEVRREFFFGNLMRQRRARA